MRTKFVASVTVALMAVTAGAAYAHYVYDAGYVWENGFGKCIHAYSEVSHGNGGGYAKVRVRAVREAKYMGGDIVVPTEDCAEDWTRTAGYLGARVKLWRYTTQGWALCRRGSWVYNGSSTADLTAARYYGTKAPCSAGWYGSTGGGKTILDGEWKGGWLWSGCHWIPDGKDCGTN